MGGINWGLLDPNQTARVANSFQDGQQNALMRAMAQQDAEIKSYGLNRAKRDDEAQNAIMSALQTASPDDIPNVYLRHGKVKEATDLIRARADTGLNEAKTATYKIDLAGQAAGYVRDNPTPQNAFATLDYLEQNKVFTPEQVAQYKAQIVQDPTQIKSMADRLYQSALSAKDQLGKVQSSNLGGKTDTVSINPLTNKVTPIMSQSHTATPGEMMTDSRVRSSLAQSERHHQDRMKGDAPKPVKPMPAAAMKMQDDDLNAIGTFAGIDADLSGILKQIKDGKLDLGPVSNITGKARNFVGMSDESSRNLATFKSKLENMRNAVLLLNKGIQTEGDAQRAMSELMENINDPDVVKQRLEEIRALNQRAVTIKRNNIGLLRRNYGQEDMDFSSYENQPQATNLNNSAPPGGTYQDPAKEQRYQAWLKSQGR